MTSRCDNETARSMCRAHRCSLRVSWFASLFLLNVVCVMLVVLIAHVDVVHAVDTVFVAIFCSGDVLFTPPVGDSELPALKDESVE